MYIPRYKLEWYFSSLFQSVSPVHVPGVQPAQAVPVVPPPGLTARRTILATFSAGEYLIETLKFRNEML